MKSGNAMGRTNTRVYCSKTRDNATWINVDDGDDFEYPLPLRLYIACCDCGLTHRFLITRTRKGIKMRIWRDNRRTGQLRRNREHVCVKKNLKEIQRRTKGYDQACR